MGTMPMESMEEISRLSDDDLYRFLILSQQDVGPIVASTRSLYEKRLYKILNSSPAESFASSLDSPHRSSPMRTEMVSGDSRATPTPQLLEAETKNESQISAVDPFESFSNNLTPNSSSSSCFPITPTISADHNYNRDVVEETPAHYFYSPNSYAQLQARRSLRSLTPDAQSAAYKRSFLGNGESKVKKMTDVTKKEEVKAKGSSAVSTVIEISILVFLIVVGYLFYYEMQSFDIAAKEAEL